MKYEPDLLRKKQRTNEATAAGLHWRLRLEKKRGEGDIDYAGRKEMDKVSVR